MKALCIILFSSVSLHQNMSPIYRIQISKWMFTCNQIALTIHSSNRSYRIWKIKNGHPPTWLFI